MVDTSTFIGDAGTFPTDDTVDYSLHYHRLYGIAGEDDLSTDAVGKVYLDGGDGNDLLYAYWDAAASFGDFYGGSGNDWLQGGATNTGDHLYGGAGDDFIEQNFKHPTTSPDYIEGGEGRDALYGAGGNDTIYGGDGDDSGGPITVAPAGYAQTATPGLFGGAGNDFLDGGRGRDLLNGGPGTDTLHGGPDNDIFQFDDGDTVKGASRDIILDFKRGDRIDVHLIDAKPGGFDNPFKFIGKKGFHDKAGELRFKGGKLAGDLDGDGKADIEIKVLDVHNLKDADLIL